MMSEQNQRTIKKMIKNTCDQLHMTENIRMVDMNEVETYNELVNIYSRVCLFGFKKCIRGK